MTVHFVTSARSSTTLPAFGTAVFVSNADPSRTPLTMPLMIPSDQVYYWSNEWQASEQRARQDLAAGRVARFASPGDAAKHLLSAE